jgi:manganese/zinc/iron transport system substrate-binding protein
MRRNRTHRASRSVRLLALVALAALLAACNLRPAPAPDDGRLSILTTTGQVADIVKNVGGDLVRVDSMMGAGTDPHLYVASISDVDKLRNADIVFYNGLFLEAQLDDIFEQLAERQTVIPISRDMDRADLHPSPAYVNEYDPHIWFDVPLWSQGVLTVRDALIAADPANAAAYTANAEAYLAQLADLDAYVAAQAARVPPQQRVLITAHDAFGYFGSAYGFDVLGLQGISTASEAGTGDVQQLADFIAANRIPAIFIESSVPVRNVEAVQAAVRDRGFDVIIGGELFSDAMGDDGTPEGTYIGMVRHNIDTIVSALTRNQ